MANACFPFCAFRSNSAGSSRIDSARSAHVRFPPLHELGLLADERVDGLPAGFPCFHILRVPDRLLEQRARRLLAAKADRVSASCATCMWHVLPKERLGEPLAVVLAREELPRAADALRLCAGRWIEIDLAEDVASELNVLFGRVPLVLAGALGAVVVGRWGIPRGGCWLIWASLSAIVGGFL